MRRARILVAFSATDCDKSLRNKLSIMEMAMSISRCSCSLSLCAIAGGMLDFSSSEDFSFISSSPSPSPLLGVDEEDDDDDCGCGDGGGGGDAGTSDDECPAKQVHADLLSRLYKTSKQIATASHSKMQRKIAAYAAQILQYRKQCSDYFTTQLHYDLVAFEQLSEGLNGGSVLVLKVMHLTQPNTPLPLHFVCIDHTGAMFVLAFYLKGHALNHLYKVLSQGNVVNASTLLCVANPVKRHIKFTHGSKQIDFYSITFQKAQDICIGGKFYFNQ
mmetsp:Transcript_27609/g.45492  ORF Transcript_27609/g.45492 Transcript_27609/m.45492 type:complete len:274 (+) Transcript_27609:829-1650(+)